LILNLMPCVLPVISLKLYSLLKQQSESDNRILKHNLSYTAGILSCFITLAAIIIGIKKSGEDIGWGFQLQSPIFLVLMVFVLFIFCLNLFGLFEFATPGGRTLGGREVKEGFVGDFFSGIFATILSTPCSAPFLGTALTFAFTTSNTNILFIFLMIGLGLASPFLLTGFFPKLTHFLPRPGLWMEHLKKFLGFTLLLTAVWLYDVLYSNNPPSSLFNFLNLSLSLLFFTFYLRKTMPKNKIASSFFLLASILSITFTFKTSMIMTNKTSQVETPKGWENFNEEKLNSIKDQVVFVDFTAEWCFTCKVNEKLLLNTSRFSDFAQKNGILLMKGDWTKKDDAITTFLKRYNVFGVPAYFLKKKNGEIIFLGELVTLDKIQAHLN
jgi:thiol:disulfide interchange protein